MTSDIRFKSHIRFNHLSKWNVSPALFPGKRNLAEFHDFLMGYTLRKAVPGKRHHDIEFQVLVIIRRWDLVKLKSQWVSLLYRRATLWRHHHKKMSSYRYRKMKLWKILISESCRRKKEWGNFRILIIKRKKLERFWSFTSIGRWHFTIL